MTISDIRSSRRKFVQVLATLASALGISVKNLAYAGAGEEDVNWNPGALRHLLPTANHEQFLIKASFRKTLAKAPLLKLNGRLVKALRSDTQGYFWQFHVDELKPDTVYNLQIVSSDARALCDPWPLKTFPRPEQDVDRCRILAFTCAGGNENIVMEDGTRFFLPLAARQKLLHRGLEFEPDLVIANGDHIYWDQRTLLSKSGPLVEAWQKIYQQVGSMDRDMAVLGTSNEAILKRIVDPQIADLYGTTLRSTPSYMLTDDHDLFENDEAHDDYISLPPEAHSLEAARATQYLYYPEFLPDRARPASLPGSSASDRMPGLSEVFGTLRYGKLLEALLYDTKRYVSLEGNSAGMVPAPVESWLKDRTNDEDTAHLIHIPSTPIGWSAGKWGEWYPDLLEKDGRLGTSQAKPYWPAGWWEQHQRILSSLASQKKRPPLIANGDLHNFAIGRIQRSGKLNFEENPVHTVCVGPLGSAGPLFPSTSFRKTAAQVPSQMKIEEVLKPLEKNGFSIIDITREKIVFRLFAWRPPEKLAAIDDLEPVARFVVERKLS